MNPSDFIQCEDLPEEFCSHCGYPSAVCNCLPTHPIELTSKCYVCSGEKNKSPNKLCNQCINEMVY